MKKVKFLAMLIAFIGMGISFTSCSSDDEFENYAKEIEGIYTGKLEIDNSLAEDAATITITRISNTVVSLEAKFLNEKINFNIEKNDEVYRLKNETLRNYSINIQNKYLSLSMQAITGIDNNGNYYVSYYSFDGKRD